MNEYFDGAVNQLRARNCRLASPETHDDVHSVFNQVWTEFWNDHSNYAEWEKQAVAALRQECLNP